MLQRDARVVLLAGGGGLPLNATSAALDERFQLKAIVLEPRESRLKMIRRRRTKLGSRTVLDQLVFQTLVSGVLRREARARYASLLSERNWDGLGLPSERVVTVPSINSASTLEHIARAAPDVVVICGTRILSKSLLEKITVPIVNLHAGITPRYRGVHGAYWALAEGRPELAGVTVHRVDAGIDTGAILARATVDVSPQDSFVTYPILQLSVGLPLLVEVVERLAAGERWTVEANAERAPLRYHPRASQYLFRRWLDGVK